jgi:hypothetical protein
VNVRRKNDGICAYDFVHQMGHVATSGFYIATAEEGLYDTCNPIVLVIVGAPNQGVYKCWKRIDDSHGGDDKDQS